VINALSDKVSGRILLGIDGNWGDDVGQGRYDPGLHRLFVTVQQFPNPDDPNLLPPAGTARLVAIDPVRHTVLTRLMLPDACFTPHGLAIDPQHHIAFIACVNADPPGLVRVDLQTMKVIAEPPWPVQVKPDILAFDRASRLLYVGCAVGISVFKETGRQLQWLGNYSFGVNTHTAAVDPVTHDLYVPVPRLGNRPVLRILHYDAVGTPRLGPTSAANTSHAPAPTAAAPRTIVIHNAPRTAVVGQAERVSVLLPGQPHTALIYILHYSDGHEKHVPVRTDGHGYASYTFRVSPYQARHVRETGTVGVADANGRVLAFTHLAIQQH
jgi:hypothetical protein